MPQRWSRREECFYCGKLTEPATYKHYFIHCDERRCRALYGFWWVTNATLGQRTPPTARYRGPLVGLWELAEFLRRMAEPKTPREIEFAKRFAHRRCAA